MACLFYFWASLVAQLIKNLPAMQETPSSISGSRRTPEERIGYLLQYSQASLVAQTVKNLPAMWETWVQPWVGTIPWRKVWQPLQYSCLENPHGQRTLAGYSPWGHKELDMT